LIDFSKIKGKIYFDGKFIDTKKAKIHVLNHSLHFAASVFEGIAIYNNKPLFEKDHFKRFINSAKILRLNLNIGNKKFSEINRYLIKKNKTINGYIRPILYRSTHSMSPDTTHCKSCLAIATWSWGTLFSKKAISLDISRWPKLNKKIFPIQAKSSGSYQSSVIARIESKKNGYDDCLMLDTNGLISETTACNIFWIKNNQLYTPKTDSALNGITRQAVIKISRKLGIKVNVGNYKLNNILKADTVFLTGTAAELQLVNNLKRKRFNIENPIYLNMKKYYDKIKFKTPQSVDGI